MVTVPFPVSGSMSSEYGPCLIWSGNRESWLCGNWRSQAVQISAGALKKSEGPTSTSVAANRQRATNKDIKMQLCKITLAYSRMTSQLPSFTMVPLRVCFLQNWHKPSVTARDVSDFLTQTIGGS